MSAAGDQVAVKICETAGELPYERCREEDLEASQRKRRDTPGAADKLVKVIKALFNRAVGAKPLPATIHGRLKRSINTGSFIRSAASRASRWGS